MFRRLLPALTLLLAGASLGACRDTGAESPAEANLPNPASVYCEEQGNRLDIVTAADGSQSGLCTFPDGTSCDEWAYYRGECGPSGQGEPGSQVAMLPTVVPIDPSDYQGWWTYTHPVYNFTIMLPEDWAVEEVTTGDPLMSGHALTLHSRYDVETESIRLTFRRQGEETLLWPTGVGQGEFIAQGTLDVAGQAVERKLLLCPTGEVTAIWYQGAGGAPNLVMDDMEFGFIYSASATHCDAGKSLSGKVQYLGEMIIASLAMP